MEPLHNTPAENETGQAEISPSHPAANIFGSLPFGSRRAERIVMSRHVVERHSYGRDIHVFDWFVIPTPFGPAFGLASFLHGIHAFTAGFILVAVILHIGGVYKHTAFNQDGTLAKIIIPGRQSPDAADSAAQEQNGGEL